MLLTTIWLIVRLKCIPKNVWNRKHTQNSDNIEPFNALKHI